ncbi:hypothetical protein PR048_000989 [Dryococelus australis]|uniref:Uncharacterized protein n=1 Tax=Dryococelus australis TaxID=614101 RepID=A0ABQ9IG42_9NEOP|nr:hypothetical protein PR048_000989 [Dryococelus australis]
MYVNSTVVYENILSENEFLTHASVADVNQRENVTYESLDFFCKKFSFPLSEIEICDLELEFAKYQSEDLPQEILMCDRMEVSWYMINNMKNADGMPVQCASKGYIGNFVYHS